MTAPVPQVNKSDLAHSQSASILSSNDSLASPKSVFEDKLSKLKQEQVEAAMLITFYFIIYRECNNQSYFS
jgi:hypothetical protein